jgi:hypothetical protein
MPTFSNNPAACTGSTVSPQNRHLHNHEWVVFSTALADVSLMVRCDGCGAWGTVDDPSAEEWSEAFHAPTKPYRWNDGSRVRERGYDPHSVKAADGP